MSKVDQNKKMEEFDEDIYRMTSPNNMPQINEFVSLTEDEKLEMEKALKLSKEA